MYFSHFRMKSTIYTKHFLSQIWKLYQEDFTTTLRIQTTNKQSLWSYSCFGLMAMKTQEDRIVGMYPPGCTQYRYAMLDVLMWALVWIGVAAIHLDYSRVDLAAWGVSKEKSTPSMLQRTEDDFLKGTWNASTERWILPTCTPDKIHGLWNYVMPVTSWGSYVLLS